MQKSSLGIFCPRPILEESLRRLLGGQGGDGSATQGVGEVGYRPSGAEGYNTVPRKTVIEAGGKV
jgi:hypothetical protein